MSTDCTAHTLAGSRIPINKLKKIGKERGCSHPVSGSKYCSECGEKMWIEDEGWILSPYKQPPEKSNVSILAPEGYYNDEWVFICSYRASCGPGSAMKVTIGNIEEGKAKVKSFLGPLGLWNPKDFGIWCVSEVS